VIAGTPFEVDDRFLQQVYRLTTVLALIATPILWAVYGLPASLSFAIGSLFSLSAILSLEFIIRRMVKPGGSPWTKRWLGFIALGKYTIIFVGFYLLTKADWLNAYTLAAGVGLVQVVIILKAIVLMIGILSNNNTTGTK
jgi:hypothetical protein